MNTTLRIKYTLKYTASRYIVNIKRPLCIVASIPEYLEHLGKLRKKNCFTLSIVDMSISSTSGSLQSHLSSSKEKILSLSPICPRCQEFLDLCDFKQIVPLSHSESLKLSTSRVVENCFLCLQFLGLYLAEPAQQAEYIEALRLNPQLVFDGFQQWSFCYNINSHSIARIFPPYHHTEEEIRNRSDSISSELQMLGVYSQKGRWQLYLCEISINADNTPLRSRWLREFYPSSFFHGI